MSNVTDGIISELDSPRSIAEQDHASEIKLESAFSILSFAELTWKERHFVSRSTLMFFAVFTLVAFILPKHYKATTRLMPPSYGSNSGLAMALPALSDSGSGGGSGGIMGLAGQLLGMNTSGELFAGVIQSRSVEDHIIQSNNLMTVYSDRYLEDARKQLESHTTIETVAQTGIINISFDDKNPSRAATIANAYVSELNKVLAAVNTSSAHRERIFLEERLEEVKQQSDADAKEFALFASQNAAVDIPDQAKSMVAAEAGLQSQLIVAQSELKGLQQIYADNNSRVRTVKARVEELQRQLDKFGGKDVDPARDQSLDQKELYPSVRQIPLLGIKYLDLYRRAKVDDAVFELLTKEYEIAKIQEAREIPVAQVLDVATVPEKKSSPHRLQIMLLGALGGMIFACLYLVGDFFWKDMDDNNPWKLLLRNIVSSINSRLNRVPWVRKKPLLRMTTR